MIKTVKVKKSVQLRLDELIKYVWDNDFSVRGYTVFRSDCDKFEVRVSTHMLDYVWDNTSKFSDVPRHATFTVEVEEKITWDTVFECLIEILPNDEADIWYGSSVNDFETTDTQKVYALIEGKLELIWEAE